MCESDQSSDRREREMTRPARAAAIEASTTAVGRPKLTEPATASMYNLLMGTSRFESRVVLPSVCLLALGHP